MACRVTHTPTPTHIRGNYSTPVLATLILNRSGKQAVTRALLKIFEKVLVVTKTQRSSAQVTPNLFHNYLFLR